MTDRSNRDVEYIVIPNRKPKITPRYYYYDDDDDDDDDDNDSQLITTSRRIVRTKPIEEPRTKYLEMNNLESEDRRQNVTEFNDNGIKVRQTNDGEQIILDEDDNFIKIIRNKRTPTPPIAENRRLRIRRHEPRTVYYETTNGDVLVRPPKNHDLIKKRSEYIYTDDEPTKVLRKVIIKPTINDYETIYEKDKSKKYSPKKVKMRKPINEIPVDTQADYEQQPQYVQIVRRRIIPREVIPKKESPTKYVMIRKKLHSEPAYTTTSPIPTVRTNRRIVYEEPKKNTSTKYVYATDGKYYK